MRQNEQALDFLRKIAENYVESAGVYPEAA